MFSAAATDREPPTLVIGLGNPILADDGVGWRVADALERRLSAGGAPEIGPVEIDRLSVGGLALMERLVGYTRAILVDATLDGQPPGTIRVGTLAEFDSRLAGHLNSAHDTTLSSALATGTALGAALPRELTVVTVSATQVGDFGEWMTPAVAAAVPFAVERVIELIAPNTA